MKLGIYCSALAIAVCTLAPQAMAQDTATYTYDALGRLTGRSTSGGTNAGTTISTTFDAAGNRTNYTVSNPTTPTFSIAPATATEGTTLVFTVTRTGITSSAMTVNYATANGTALAGSDYTTTSGTLSFAASQTTATISVPTINDSAAEATETFIVSLSAPSGGAVLGTASANGTINDNDTTAVSFAIGNAPAVIEGGTLTYTVTKSGSTSATTTVNYATANGTAAAGSDYTAKSGTLTFLAGETTKSITVSTTNDTAIEASETVLVNLSGASGATITTSQGSGTITDNDTPTVSFSIGNATAVSEGGTFGFTVTKTGTTSITTSVNYATANGTATAGSDYTAKSGTLSFLASETSKVITVSTTDDAAVESAETIFVNLSGAVSATIGTSQGTGTINDNDGLITLTNGSLAVLPAHTSVYSCTVGALPPTYTIIVRQCKVIASNMAVLYQLGNNTPTVQAGYTYNTVTGVLMVTSASYGTP